MKTIENFKSKELTNKDINSILGGESESIDVGNTIVDDLNGLIR